MRNPRFSTLQGFVLLLLLMGLPTARADDVLEKSVHFQIGPAPLASALIEFSTQSGVQVAMADQDDSHLRTHGVNGNYRIGDALNLLLQGTGLEFSRVGAQTLAIRSPSRAQPDGSPQFPDVAVIAPQPPTADQLTGDSVYQFIVHHATTPYPSSQAALGSLTRWRGGRPETICPLTLGLDPGYNAFVTARIRALAAAVGAPVQGDVHCKDNVRILFTTDPDKLMNAVYQWAGKSLGVKHPDQPKKLLLQSSGHAIQGWYITAGGSRSNVLNTDPDMLGHLDLLPLWPLVIQTGINGAGCCYGGIVDIILVVNTAKVAGATIGSIADYLGMVTLSLVQQPDHCDPLPSILDLMAASCGTRAKPSGITAADLAFLRALYYHNTGLGPSLSREDMQLNMMQQFKGS